MKAFFTHLLIIIFSKASANAFELCKIFPQQIIQIIAMGDNQRFFHIFFLNK